MESSITLANIQEDSELVFTEAQLLNGFDDPDGDPSPSPDSPSTPLVLVRSMVMHENGGYTFTANPNYNGPVELTYSVTDGTDTTSATASFNVFSVNDAPSLMTLSG